MHHQSSCITLFLPGVPKLTCHTLPLGSCGISTVSLTSKNIPSNTQIETIHHAQSCCFSANLIFNACHYSSPRSHLKQRFATPTRPRNELPEERFKVNRPCPKNSKAARFTWRAKPIGPLIDPEKNQIQYFSQAETSILQDTQGMQKPWPLAALHLNSSWEEGFDSNRREVRNHGFVSVPIY